MKVTKIKYNENLTVHAFHCPGCGYPHSFDTRWEFNENYEKPTFTPSLLVFSNNPEMRCHLWVTDGKIQYLNDCFHTLAGKTIEMEDCEEY